MTLRRLLVDLGQLAVALDAPAGGPTRAFLDRVSGEIEFVPRDVEVADYDDLLSDPQRWVEITPASRLARIQLRARFADGVDDVLVRPALAQALDDKHLFQSFDRALRQSPRVQEDWLRFRDRELAREGRRWLLETLGIDAL